MKSKWIGATAIFLAVQWMTAAAAAQGPTAAQVAAEALQQQANAQNPLLGSVPEGQATAETLPLTLKDAIARGLRNNLGPVLAGQVTRAAAGARWQALAHVLPHVNATSGWVKEEINLSIFGLPLPAGTPTVVGPFSVVDSRARLTQNVFDLHSLEGVHASSERLKASQLDYEDARDLVVLAVAGLYFQVEANGARVTAAKARLATAEALYRQAVDLKAAGVVAGIDVLRADVERKAEQQRLVADQNGLDKSKLQLGRAIGLPAGQKFELAEKVPYQAAPPITEEMALETAYKSRSDYAAAKALVRAAEYEKNAARAERLPALSFNADYGHIGRSNYANSRATYSLGLMVDLPIFQGGKEHGDALAADAQLKRREAQLADLRGRIDYEVRSALLDLNTAAQQVQVSQEAVQLSDQELQQARDRFAAGVADNLEVTRAQEALATANENLIAAVYAHNFAKASLARAMGVAVEAAQQFLGGTK